MMNATTTLEKTEVAIAGLSSADKKKLLRRLSHDVGATLSGVEKNVNVMGGAACILNTRIPVWMLYRARDQGVSEADLLKNYPGLSAEDLVNAWDYAVMNRDEIELQILQNDRED